MKINPSADIDYNILKKGIYLYKINDDITTNSALHTIEHIVNTYLETVEFADNIIFFGPMGSRTGFYLLTKNLSDKYSIELIRNAFNYVAEFWGRIPNASPNVIKDWTKDDLAYPVAPPKEDDDSIE